MTSTRKTATRPKTSAASANTVTVQLVPWQAKILAAIYYLGPGKIHPYEDIVVSAFEHFRDEARFQLRGHPEYPDSSDLHKPLYKELKRAGYVTARDKRFGLTTLGTAVAQQYAESLGGGVAPGFAMRLDRENEKELKRLMGTEAVKRFQEHGFGTVIDTDFHEFFRTSVRMPIRGTGTFAGRLAQVAAVIEEARRTGSAEAEVVELVRLALLEKFKALIAAMGGKS